MNTHKHARLTFLRRLEMVQQLIAHQVCVPEAARAYGVTAPTVRKWLGRFLAQGQAGLADASSRPTVSPRAIAPAKALAIVELRRKRLTQARIAQALGVSASTVSRVLARAGLSHLADLEPAEPVVRYEHQAPGDLLHIDIKKLGRIQRPGHRVTGNRRDTVEGAGWDFVFVAIDDHARVAFTDIHPDERFPSAVQFLKDAVAYYQRLGVTIQRLLTDNGSAFRSRAFAALCHELGIKHRFTRPYRPQTNGKAERFIQSALREWAYAHTYQNSQHRADAMKSWLHHYNWHRPHQGIGRAVPISRLNLDEYNLLTVHTYLAYLAWQVLRAPAGGGGGQRPEPLARGALYRRGIIMNLTNPKVLLFFFAFLPQFTRPEAGPMGWQIVELGAVFMLATLLVFGAIAVFSGGFGRLLQRSARAQRWLNRLAGLVFIGLALRLATASR
ncbi:IS481 family transposase [Bordetella pertussis]|nr:IS481 family transposase [Bordetella pertussis]